MYSPKISEDLIPMLYRLSRAFRRPMTKVVDEFLRPNVLQSYSLITPNTEGSNSHGEQIKDSLSNHQL